MSNRIKDTLTLLVDSMTEEPGVTFIYVEHLFREDKYNIYMNKSYPDGSVLAFPIIVTESELLEVEGSELVDEAIALVRSF